MENLLSGKKILNLDLKIKVFGIATIAFIGLVLAVRQPTIFKGWTFGSPKVQPLDSSSFWAVYLDSGQVFYGKKSKSDKNYVVMSNVFYYHPAIKLTVSGNVRLVKVGTEIHQPQDYVYINKVHIDRQEQLTDDSKVVKAIEQYNE